MNIHAEEFLAETPLTMRRHLADAITIYSNDFTADRQDAICAIISGRAAYWSTAGYSAQRAGILLGHLNRGCTFEEALADAYDNQPGSIVERGLDTLVPLNLKAANALSLAYSHHTATWHDEEELLMRRVRDCRKAVA